jgi:aryl-alcohol dehydrogenase-like predicted oxidoreductase
MLYGSIPGIDKPVSRLIQGTVFIVSSERAPASFALLDAVFEMGCNTFDMAHGYGGGDVERTFGRWLHESGKRDEVVVITKGAHPNIDRWRVTPHDITSDLFDSLARLKIDTIDLYLLHRDDVNVPVGPLMDVLNEHHAAGRIRAFGGSNWTHERLQEANEYAAKHNLVPFVASSPQFSLAEQHQAPWRGCISVGGAAGAGAREWYTRNQMPLLTWSSLAGGFFSGRFRRNNLDTFKEYADTTTVMAYAAEDNFERLDRAEKLAKDKGVTLPQIALAYVTHQSMNMFALVGSQTADEFRMNLEAQALALTPDEIAWLETGEPQGVV